MFRILLPTTDFSPNSTVAVRPALSIARRFGTRIILVHAIEEPQGEPGPTAKDAFRGLVEMAREQLEELGRREIADAVPWTLDVVTGRAYVAITEAAARHDADLIVVATHGRTGLLHLLMGSVAERIVRTAACPVLTVRGPA